MRDLLPTQPGLRYSVDHLWLRPDRDQVTIGVTDRIARILTLVSEVRVPELGADLTEDDELASIESQKTTVTVNAPCRLRIVGLNETLASDPMRVRMDPFGAGWLVKAVLAKGGWEQLLDEAQYRRWVRHQDPAGGDQD
jgi:glycine cleavage system H protein